MNKEFIERIENKVNSIDILDKDPFVEESCKNIYRALLVVAENGNPSINDISNILNDTNKTIELLKKFDGINKEKYNGDLSYIVIDVNNNQTLLYLIELLRQSIYYNEEADDKKTTNDVKIYKDININIVNKILISVFLTSQRANLEKIDSIKFLPSKVGYTIEVKDNHNKLYYMGADEYGYVQIVREHSLDGKVIFAYDDDYIPPNTNNSNDIKNNDNELNNSPMSKIKNFFHIDSKNNNDVTKFAQEHGYKGAKYIGNWKEYKVYEPYFDENQVSYTGIPLVILVDNNGDIRMSTSDEAMATLDDKSFMESFEENKINEEKNSLTDNVFKPDNLSPNQASNLINNIDDKIAELQIEKEIIDKEIAENLEEVSKYSILNKNIDELLNAKKKFINDWDKLLFNTSDEHWIMNSATYRVHIVSIINAILRREQNNKSTEQLELLNKITECLGNKDRDSAIAIVKQLKEIELR